MYNINQYTKDTKQNKVKQTNTQIAKHTQTDIHIYTTQRLRKATQIKKNKANIQKTQT